MLVEVNCESDFVARTDDFKELVHDIAMHIAASDPKFVRKEDVTPEDFEREKDIYLRAGRRQRQAAATSRRRWSPARWRSSTRKSACCEQPFIKDQTISISQLIAAKIGKLGENIAVRRFARFKVGDAGATIAFTQPAGDGEKRSRFQVPAGVVSGISRTLDVSRNFETRKPDA